MLPNHAPLMVAERFKVLEALFPGRIDLGLGRAPGTDPVTSYALRARQDPREGDDFLERFQELLLLERGGFPEGHPFRKVHAVPADVALPPIWLLGSSGYSAELAAAVGMGFAFAHHFADYDAASAMLSYREHFKPSATLPRALCDPGGRGDRGGQRRASRAHRLERGSALCAPRQGRICRRSPRPTKPPPIRTRRSIANASRAIAAASLSAASTTVKSRLLALIEATRADELMVTTMVYDHAARRHSYRASGRRRLGLRRGAEEAIRQD